jgi:hypothetical protein
MTDLKTLKKKAPWDWPEDAGDTLLKLLRDGKTSPADLLTAVELSGDYVVINDELAAELLSIVGDGKRDAELRARAAISLGPILEHADMYGFEDPDDVPVTEETFENLVSGLQKLWGDEAQPDLVRRRLLEAAVRAPREWQADAVRYAFGRSELEWKQTAVFCMAFVDGFDKEILEALDNADPVIHAEAVCAAGNHEIEAAWPHISALLKSKGTDKELLLAAIDAAPSINPEEAIELLEPLTESGDEEIAEAADEAIATADQLESEDDEDWDDDEAEEEEDEK